MNTDVITNKKRIEKNYLVISCFLFIIEILIFLLAKTKRFEPMDHSIKESLQPNFFDIKDIQEIKIPRMLKIIYNFNTIHIPYLIIILVNNFSNIYNTYILFFTLSITCYISCILKFIFYETLIDINRGIIYYCGEGWNLPSTEMMLSVVFYLVLWHIFFKDIHYNYLNKGKIIIKYTLLGIIILLNIINIISLSKIGYYLFTHLFFSAILGVLIYIFIFKTNVIKNYTPKEFCHFINNKFECNIIFKIILLIISFIPYIFERKGKPNNPIKCESVEGTFLYENKSPYITYVDDTFSLMSIYLAQFFFLIGLKSELGFYFGNNIQNFEQYHFGINLDDSNSDIELNNNYDSIIITKDTEWNNTSIFKSILRLVVSLVMSCLCFLPYFYIKKENGSDFIKIFLLKYFLSFALFSFGISFIFRIIFRITRLTNEILGAILNDQ